MCTLELDLLADLIHDERTEKKKAFAISGIKSTPGRRSTMKKLVLWEIKAGDKANTPPTALIINLSVKFGFYCIALITEL